MSGIPDGTRGWRQLFKRWLQGLIARKWFDIGLRAKMSALVTVGLTGLLAIFAFVAISNIRQSTQQLLGEQVLRARILAENLDSNLRQVAGLLTILASEIDTADPHSNLQDWGAIFQKDFRSVQGVYLFDRQSRLVVSTAPALELDWAQVPALNISSAGEARRIRQTALALAEIDVLAALAQIAALQAQLENEAEELRRYSEQKRMMVETLHLFRSPANAARLLEAYERSLRGGGQPMTVDELRRAGGRVVLVHGGGRAVDRLLNLPDYVPDPRVKAEDQRTPLLRAIAPQGEPQ